MKKQWITLLGITLMAGTLVLGGCRQRSPEPWDTAHFVEEVSDELDLTTEQERDLTRIVDEARPELVYLHEYGRSARKSLHAKLGQDTVTATELEESLHTMLDELRARVPVVAKSLADFHALLTPEQRKELTEELAKHQHRRRWRWR